MYLDDFSSKDGVIKVIPDNGLVLFHTIPCDASTLRFSYTRDIQDPRYPSKRDKRSSNTLESIMWAKWGSPSIPFGRGPRFLLYNNPTSTRRTVYSSPHPKSTSQDTHGQTSVVPRDMVNSKHVCIDWLTCLLVIKFSYEHPGRSVVQLVCMSSVVVPIINIRQYTSVYVNIRQRTSTVVDFYQRIKTFEDRLL